MEWCSFTYVHMIYSHDHQSFCIWDTLYLINPFHLRVDNFSVGSKVFPDFTVMLKVKRRLHNLMFRKCYYDNICICPFISFNVMLDHLPTGL